MRTIFTLHAGEVLVGEHISQRFGGRYDVWVPAKDNGVDLLVTDKKRPSHSIRIQVKSSKSYGKDEPFGWFTPSPDKIRKSIADLWVFVIPFFNHRALGAKVEPKFIVIPVDELKRRIPRNCKSAWHLYLYMPEKRICYNSRDFKKQDWSNADKGILPKHTDYSRYIDNWNLIEKA